MFQFVFRKFRARQQVQGSMGWMLQRADDHLLEDIGMTRAELTALLRDPPVEAGPVRARARMMAGQI